MSTSFAIFIVGAVHFFSEGNIIAGVLLSVLVVISGLIPSKL